MEESMKKITALLLIMFLSSLICMACVTKNGNNNLEQGRRAAVDATRRMDNALGE
jgi:preprotein translocase subunit SecG